MDFFLGFLLSVVILFVIFLLCRELMCWYFKINESIVHYNNINVKLDKLLNNSYGIFKLHSLQSNFESPLTLYVSDAKRNYTVTYNLGKFEEKENETGSEGVKK